MLSRLPLKGAKSSLAKPFKGVVSGIFEIAQPFKGDAYRTVYAVHLGEALWVIHAFQKKSKTGIKTPKQEVELIKKRLKYLQEKLL